MKWLCGSLLAFADRVLLRLMGKASLAHIRRVAVPVHVKLSHGRRLELAALRLRSELAPKSAFLQLELDSGGQTALCQVISDFI